MGLSSISEDESSLNTSGSMGLYIFMSERRTLSDGLFDLEFKLSGVGRESGLLVGPGRELALPVGRVIESSLLLRIVSCHMGSASVISRPSMNNLAGYWIEIFVLGFAN